MQNDLIRPIIGIENRTAQEVFDIMCDRFRHLSATVPAGDGELVERLRYRVENPSAWPEGFDQDASDLMALAASRLSQGTGDSEPGWVEIIEQSLTPDGGVALTLQLDGEETTVVAHFGGSNG